MLGIVSYAAAAPFYSSTNAAKLDVEDWMPLQTDKDNFKNPGFIESLTAVIGDDSTAEANKDFTQLHTEYATQPELMEKTSTNSEATVIHQIMKRSETSGLNSVKNSDEIEDGNDEAREIKNIDVIDTTECDEEEVDQSTYVYEIDVCHPCGGSKQADDLSTRGMFSHLVTSTYDNSDDFKYYQSIYTEAAEARKDNDALIKRYEEKRLGHHHDKSNVTIRHHHRRMKLIQDNEIIATIPNRTDKEVGLSDFLQEMHDRLALGLLHLQHIHEDERTFSSVVNCHFVKHFRKLEQTHLSSLLCWFRQLEWSRNIQDSQCNISHQNVTTLFKDEGNSRSSRFYRDYVLLKFIDETLQSVQKTFSCLQLENGSHNHRWFDCMQA